MDRATAEQLVKAQLGGDDWRIGPFGAGKFSSVFSVDSPGGRYVLRVAPPDSLRQLFYEYRMMRQEPAIHARLLAETSVPVAQIVAHDFTRKLIDRDYLIMPRLEGTPLIDAQPSPEAMRRALGEVGQYVAQIHSLTDPDNRFGYLGEHRCMAPQASWREAFAAMYEKELRDIVDCGVYDGQIAKEAMKMLADHLDAFEQCDTSRLLHGDLWSANFLVQDDGEITAVLDFDRACWGDVEWDLAIVEYCGLDTEEFWAGYGRRVETHSGDAAIRRMFYLLYEHQKYIVISISDRHNNPARAARYAKDSLGAMNRFRKTGKPEF